MVARWAAGSGIRPEMYTTYGWTAHTEEASDDASEHAGRRRPPPTQSSHRRAPKHHVERVHAHEQPERPHGQLAWHVDEERHAQGEPDHGERHEGQQFRHIGLLARMKPESQT
jgi:hypothetical protein